MPIIRTLNHLIKLDLDAIAAYDAAIAACRHGEIRDTLSAFRSDHERHVRVLGDQVIALGGKPATRRDLMGVVILGFTKLVSHGDRSALLAMRGNEELTNRTYAAALKLDMPADTRAVIERNLGDERRHVAWIKEELGRRFFWLDTGSEGEARATGTDDASAPPTKPNGVAIGAHGMPIDTRVAVKRGIRHHRPRHRSQG
jgi:uncharacterized protein (TIGR02284 family)